MRKLTYVLMITAGLTLSLAGCSKNTGQENPVPAEGKPIAEDKSVTGDKSATGNTEEAGDTSKTESAVTPEDTVAKEDASSKDDTVAGEEAGSAEDIHANADVQANENVQTNEDVQTDAENPSDNSGHAGNNAPYDVIWIGDSLTQGSLGDDNHNKNNPQAPWRVLGEISGKNVTGVGFYGYKTHDIFWAYGEYDGIKDPNITYVYWVGSNDFHDSPDNIKYVIEETDRFNSNAGITKYIMLGTTNRGDMDPNAYISINKGLEDYYGDRYLDIMPYVEFGPDGVHLTEASYRKIAGAVYDKLRSMGYL